MSTPRGSAEVIENTADSPKRKTRRWAGLLVLLAAAAAAYALYPRLLNQQTAQAQSSRAHRRDSGGPAPVVATLARTGDMPVYLDGIGNVQAFYTVQLRTRVDGQIVKVNFKEGQLVKEGDSLVEIDPRPFQVQLEQARGQLAKDEALLGQAKANEARDSDSERYARAEAERYGNLFAQGIVSKEQGDQYKTTADTQAEAVAADHAAIDSAQAQIVADKAAIDSANLQLTYAHITAPLTGRIGLRMVDPGNIVHATDTNALAVITQLQPIAVIFNLPSDNLPQVSRIVAEGRTLPVFAYDHDLRTKLAAGKLVTIDNQIDQTTGTVKLKAVFDNADLTLFPNQFVNARMLIDTRRGAVLLPVAAVQHSPQSAFVYVVKPDHTVEVRNVTVGIVEGDRASIEKGVQAGDEVVIDGIDKLRQGAAVNARIVDTPLRAGL